MIDLHGHYLPWVDGGASSLEEALQMLRMAEADGVRFAALTPTIDPARSPVARVELEKKFAAFAQLVQRRGIDVRLRLGAELVHGPGAIEAVDRREIPFIGEWEGRRVALLRWAEDFIPIGAISAAQQLIARGILPMLAHPERNPGVIRSPGALDLFLCDGCLVQVDAGSVLGWHGPEVRETAFRLIEAGRVTVLASGAADTSTRPPMLRAARDIVAQRFGDEIAIRLTELNPSLVVAEDLSRGFDAHVAPAGGAVGDIAIASPDPQPAGLGSPFAAGGMAEAADAALVLADAVDPRLAHSRPLGPLGIRGEARSAAPGRDDRPVPADTAGAGRRRSLHQRRGGRPDQEPVIAPPDSRLPLMRF